MENNNSLWGKYWITPGMDVVHRNDITELNIDRLSLMKMTVDKVVKRSKEKEGVRKVYVEGVRCHWLDNDRKFQQGQFHTNELVPYEIAKVGINEVNKWIARETR